MGAVCVPLCDDTWVDGDEISLRSHISGVFIRDGWNVAPDGENEW